MPIGRRTGGGGGGGGARVSAARASAAAHKPSGGSSGLRAAATSHGVSRPSSSAVAGGASRMTSASSGGGGGGGGLFSALRQGSSAPSTRHAAPPCPPPGPPMPGPPPPHQHYGGPPPPGPGQCHPPPMGCHPPPPGCPPPSMHGHHQHPPPPPMRPPCAGHRRHHYRGPYCGPHPGFWCGPPRPRCFYYRPYRPPLLLLTALFVGVPLIRLYSRRSAANASASGGAKNVSKPLQPETIAYKGGVHPIKPYSFQIPYTEGRCKGLFIGINYFGTKAELKGCCHDVAVMIDTMKELQFPLEEAAILVDDPKFKGASGMPTRDNIIQHMEWLVKDAKAGDVLFFHYSGHGGQAKDPEASSDNQTGMCETMIPSDYKTAGMIADADIFELMVRNLPSGVRLTVIMDCCHSSSLMDLPFSYVASEGNMSSCSKMMADRRYQTRQTRGDVIMFSGVDANEKAADVPDTSHSFKGNSSYGAGGAVTNAFAMVLTRTTGLTINQLLDEMRKVLVSRNILQTPQFTASKPIDLTQPFSFFGEFSADTHYYAAPSGSSAAGPASSAAAAAGQEVELNVWVQPPSDDPSYSSSSSSSPSPLPPPSYPAATGAGPTPSTTTTHVMPQPTMYGSLPNTTPSSTTPQMGAVKQPAPLPPGPMPPTTMGANVPFHMMTPAQQQQAFMQQQQMLQQQQLLLAQQQQQIHSSGGAGAIMTTPQLPMMPTPPTAPYTYSASAVPPAGTPQAPQSQHVTPHFAAASFPSPLIGAYFSNASGMGMPPTCILPPSPSLMMAASGGMGGSSILGMGMGLGLGGSTMMLNPALLGFSTNNANATAVGGRRSSSTRKSMSNTKSNAASWNTTITTTNDNNSYGSGEASGSHTPASRSAVGRTFSSSLMALSAHNSKGNSPSVASRAAPTPPAYRHPPTYEDSLRGSVCSADGTPAKPYVRVGVAGAGVPIVPPSPSIVQQGTSFTTTKGDVALAPMAGNSTIDVALTAATEATQTTSTTTCTTTIINERPTTTTTYIFDKTDSVTAASIEFPKDTLLNIDDIVDWKIEAKAVKEEADKDASASAHTLANAKEATTTCSATTLELELQIQAFAEA